MGKYISAAYNSVLICVILLSLSEFDKSAIAHFKASRFCIEAISISIT